MRLIYVYFFLFCKIIFSPDLSGCDVNLTVTDTKQYFATEGYPYSYKRNQNCHFNFNAPAGRKIIVIFKVFDLEYGFDFLHFRKLQSSDTSNALIILQKHTHFFTQTLTH